MSKLNRTPVWRGARGLTENEDSPEVVNDSTALTVTRSYTGTYETCLAQRPAYGAAVAGFGSGVIVESSAVKRQPGGRGMLVVIAKKDLTNTANGGGIATQPPEFEVDWMRIDVPLEKSSRYKDLSETDLKAAAIYLADPINAAYPAGWDGNALLREYVGKKQRGVESVMAFTPVVRRITPHSAPPAVSKCGFRDPSPIPIPGYTFLKTADRRSRRDNRWSRDEEWTGFEEVDTDLYPSS